MMTGWLAVGVALGVLGTIAAVMWGEWWAVPLYVATTGWVAWQWWRLTRRE